MAVKLNETGIRARSHPRARRRRGTRRTRRLERARPERRRRERVHREARLGRVQQVAPRRRRRHGPRHQGHYSFPYGDFDKVHRCAVISLESRAGQYDHDDIRDEAKKLLELIDEED